MGQRLNEFNQPIGDEMIDWQKSALPGDVYIEGQYAVVTKLSAEYITGLYNAFKCSARSNWTYLMESYPESLQQFESAMQNKIDDPARVCYVVLNKQKLAPLGIFSLMRMDQHNGVIEVGNVIFSDALRQSTIATDAQYLLARYVFEQLGYRRYEWKCDSLNEPSIRAAKRLGFTYEGTFRHALIYKNRTRDTCWFSMLLEEWPAMKLAYERWLSPNNFDEYGQQIHSLQQLKTV